MSILPPSVKIRYPEKLFIAGKWVAPSSDGRIEVVNPATEQVIAKVAEAREADMDKAVAAAREAFDKGPWPRLSPVERAAYMMRLAKALRAREPELAAAWTEQVGGLASFGPMMVGGGTAPFEVYAAAAASYPFETRQPSMIGGTAVLRREPVGVVVAIAPWNAPYTIMAQKCAAALFAGCTTVLKPSPETPLETFIMAECAEEAGLPPGVINVVPAHREASDYLVRRPGVDKISFTGSTAAGRRIASVSGERIARCTLELGGKSAAIVLDDFDVAEAAKILSQSISIMSGQVCATLSRVIVPRKRHDDFVDAFNAELKAIRVGVPTDPESQMGPLAMERQRDRVEGYIAKGKAEGAKLTTGGGRPAHLNRGFYIEPTLFANVDNAMTIAQEEIFGPVLCLIPAEDAADAIRLSNESIYGLNGAVFTHDAQKAYDVACKVRTGGFGQNGLKMDFGMPFGGYKQSGIGREGGMEGLAPYFETKTILLD